MKFFLAFVFVISLGVLDEITINKELTLKVDFIEVDSYGFLYVLKGGNISKFNYYGIKLASFQSPNGEIISSIDVSNPFKIIVFYKPSNKIRFIDNKMNNIGDEINLTDFNISNSDIVCSSSESGFWVLNFSLLKLIKFNAFYKPEFERDLSEYGDEAPSYMLDVNNRLYVNFPDKGILCFDSYGIYDNTFDIKGIDNFQVYKNKIYSFYKPNNRVKIFDIENFSNEEIVINDTIDCKNAKIILKDVFLQTDDKILIGKLKKR